MNVNKLIVASVSPIPACRRHHCGRFRPSLMSLESLEPCRSLN